MLRFCKGAPTESTERPVRHIGDLNGTLSGFNLVPTDRALCEAKASEAANLPARTFSGIIKAGTECIKCTAPDSIASRHIDVSGTSWPQRQCDRGLILIIRDW